MTEINLLFEFAHDEALAQVAQTLQDRLSRMEMVEEVEAVPEGSKQMRLSGLEIAAAIGVTVLVVRSSRELVEEVRKFVTEIKALMVDLRDLKMCTSTWALSGFPSTNSMQSNSNTWRRNPEQDIIASAREPRQ